jgi:hyperosmotically inducible periplasmic protein
MQRFILCLLVLTGLCGCGDKTNTSPTGNSSKPTDADNTAVNARDKDSSAKTPIDQNENKADLETSQKIRKDVVATDMSTNAKNVKIITQNGEVTLRGPVKTADEKQKIEEIARNVAGKDKVVNQLEVEQKP